MRIFRFGNASSGYVHLPVKGSTSVGSEAYQEHHDWPVWTKRYGTRRVWEFDLGERLDLATYRALLGMYESGPGPYLLHDQTATGNFPDWWDGPNLLTPHLRIFRGWRTITNVPVVPVGNSTTAPIEITHDTVPASPGSHRFAVNTVGTGTIQIGFNSFNSAGSSVGGTSSPVSVTGTRRVVTGFTVPSTAASLRLTLRVNAGSITFSNPGVFAGSVDYPNQLLPESCEQIAPIRSVFFTDWNESHMTDRSKGLTIRLEEA